MESDTIEAETAEQRDRRIKAEMEAGGFNPTQSVAVDYFGVDRTEKVMFPDGVSYVVIKELDEGARRKYQNATNKDVRLARQTGDAYMKLGAGDDRLALLKVAIVDWNLKRAKSATDPTLFDVPFKASELDKFLDKAPTSIVDLIEKRIRKMNSWVEGEITLEDIDKQMEELKEMRERKLEEEEGKAD